MTVNKPEPGHVRPARLRRWLSRSAARVQRVNRAICVLLLAGLLACELAIVLLRYGLSTGRLELQDLAAYLFAALVMLGLPVALGDNRHVRVDVLREHQDPKMQHRTDTTGYLLLLLPALLLTLYHAMPDVMYAWQIQEGSRETGGLGGVYLVKTLLPVSCVLLLLQGVSRVWGRGRDDPPRDTTRGTPPEAPS